MADGVIDNLHPPGNRGLSHGAGMVTSNDGTRYVFQTPSDNDGKELVLGPVSFTLSGNGKHIESVTQTTDNPLGGG